MAARFLTAAVLLLALTACDDGPAAEPATVPVPGTSSAAPVPDRFAAVVQQKLPDLAVDHRDDEILAVAQQACSALRDGRSASAVVADVVAFGADPAGARELVKLAIGGVCPEQVRRLDEF